MYGTLWGSLEIPGGPLVIHLDRIENHWFRRTTGDTNFSYNYRHIKSKTLYLWVSSIYVWCDKQPVSPILMKHNVQSFFLAFHVILPAMLKDTKFQTW